MPESRHAVADCTRAGNKLLEAMDQDGLLRNGASPNLPSDYLQAIDGLKPNPMEGTCAAAAATGCVVITQDFCDDDKWAELRQESKPLTPSRLRFLLPTRGGREGRGLALLPLPSGAQSRRLA